MPTDLHVVFPGDGDRAGSWSGIPGGVLRGLRELGVDASHLSAEPPRALRLPLVLALSVARRSNRRAVTEASAEMAALRSLALRARLLRAHGDGPIVQIGTGYAVPGERPVVTLEDMTIPQAVALRIPEWQAQPEHCVRARIRLQRASYGRALGCCVASDWAARSVLSDYGVPSEKVHVVGLGRNHDPRPAPRDWAQPRFLFVGRDWSRKGGPELLRAFGRLREQLPDATLDVVGAHPRLDAAGVRGHGPLILPGRGAGDRVRNLFETATCCVMPSRFEPFGIVHVEAAAAGVPSIGTTVGGAGYAIGPRGGRLVRPGDGEGLLDAMVELSNPDTAMRMGAAALERSARFTWRAVAERVLEALGGVRSR
jgi:glycosyltransferase involved in cell wall biosynthesis